MPAKDLYMATSIEELNKRAVVGTTKESSSLRVERLAKTANNLLLAASKVEKEEDEERAYILYMRYVNLCLEIKQLPDYKRADGCYVDLMLSKSDLKKAVEAMERLQSRLEDRYRQRLKLLGKRVVSTTDRDREMSPKLTVRKTTAKNGILSLTWPSVIEPRQFFKLMTEKSTSFLILDARPKDDYRKCRIKHSHVINVPQECLQPGITANKIEKAIRVDERDQWRNRRTVVDLLIMLDWMSEAVEESKHLIALKDAMVLWDSVPKYNSLPHLLKGGIENFAMHYPVSVENPDRARNPPPSSKSRNSSKGVKDALSQISQLEYPDLDAAFIASPSPHSSPTNSSSNNNMLSSSSSTTAAAAVASTTSLYPSTDDLSELNKAFVSGAITVIKEASPTYFVPAGKSFGGKGKGGVTATSAVSRTISSSLMPSVVPSRITKPAITTPHIDRSLKAKLLVRHGHNGHSGEMRMDVQEAENDLVDDSLELERQQLELEKRWELLRLRREKEAEEEMKQEVMKKEEQLLEEMQKMADEKLVRERENKDLRLQLEQMKRDLKSEESNRKLLESKERERLRLREEVERKRTERLKKQRDQEQMEERRKKLHEAEVKRCQVEREVAEKEQRQQQQQQRMIVRLKEDGEEFYGNLNRSHSSPNIAKMLDYDDGTVNSNSSSSSRPAINRAKKPSTWGNNNNNRNESMWEKPMARFRNFQPVLGTRKPCLTGLKNLGNTCYMNGILQCLSNLNLLSFYFLDRAFLCRDLNAESATQGNVAIEFAEVLRMLRCGQYNSIVPSDFKNVIGTFDSKFRTNDQQDAHELLNKLIEWMHNDLNEVKGCEKKRMQVATEEERNNQGVPEAEAAEKAWELDKRVDRSFIRETFYGQWRSVLTCSTCSWKSVKYEPFFEMALQLPPGNGRCSLRQCIEGFLKPESVQYKCPKCDRSRDCTKKFEIVRLPSIIIIQLVRFYNDGLSRKRQNFVDFQLTDLDLGQYVTACKGQLNLYRNYNLYAVCNHTGSMEGGHYTAFCYEDQNRVCWHKFDDHEVSEIPARDINSPKAYILFYSGIS